jgi:hypothetical protein
VFVWTGLRSQADGGFFAGLVAGDGHFFIRPNNGGANWQCGLTVRLRADDTPLLADICRWSGAGKLSAVLAQGNSQPQTRWTVQRQADCLRIVSILDRHPPLGKKSLEYAIWRDAIRAWAGNSDERHALVADCLSRLRAHRAADNVPRCSRVSITSGRLMAFFAGFVTAEAHFGATPEGHPHFRINLRSDDREILRLFRDHLDLGTLADMPPYRTSLAAVSWRVARLAEVRMLTGHLDRHPPRGRVLGIYEAWRELVLLTERRDGKRRELAARVKERRAYKPGLAAIAPSDPLAARRTRHVAVLRAWADTGGGVLTATAYEAWRSRTGRRAPQRETIAAAFGSWSAAMEAAGLSTERCRSPELNRKSQARANAARPARTAALREVILAAVRQCAVALGRPPRVTEFLAWRTQMAPGVPSQGTIYRVFPEGWQSVLDGLAPEEDLHAGELT